MDSQELRKVVEALLFITDNPLSIRKLKDITGEPSDALKEAVNGINSELETRGSSLFIKEVANGFQMATRAEYGEWVKKLYIDKITYRLSKSALETLSIIAYKQPITRNEIEEIRGVDSAGVLENLFEKKLVKICGRKEAPGRPMLYGTTNEFLKYFGLKSIADMPSLEEFAPPELEGGELFENSRENENAGLETVEAEVKAGGAEEEFVEDKKTEGGS